MMLTNNRERKICEKYSARGEDGFVRCKECPLVKDRFSLLCKANSHYNRSTKEWEPDLEEIE
mgnify:CR=1 FL=1